jgi:subtilisin family serine protease
MGNGSGRSKGPRSLHLLIGAVAACGALYLLLPIELARSAPPAPPVPGSTPSAPAVSPKLTPAVAELLAGDPDARRPLWIFLSEASRSAAPAQLKRMEDAIHACGTVLRHRSRWLNAMSVEAPLSAVPRLAALPFVERVQLVNRGRRSPPGGTPPLPKSALKRESISGTAAGTGLDPYGHSRAQLEQIDVVALNELGYTGTGVRVALFDDGFRTTHPATRSLSVIAERDFVFQDDIVDPEPGDPPTTADHGTATWAELGGYDPGLFLGAAYGAEFVLAKTEDIRAEYPVEEDNYVAALEWADSLGARVVSVSLAYFIFDGEVGYGRTDLDGETIPLSRAVETAVSRGMVVVNAAGNSGPSSTSLECPADARHVIAVGAVDASGAIMDWSSRGPSADGRIKPEVVAMGWGNWTATTLHHWYDGFAGTSAATPLIAGGAALLLEAHPDWDAYRVREALIETARRAEHPDNDYGYGIADVAAAARLEPMAPPRRPFPFVLLDPQLGMEVTTWSPVFRWTASRSAVPRDHIAYSIVLSRDPTFASADTMRAGPDTTWAADPAWFGSTTGAWYWTVVAADDAGWTRSPFQGSWFLLTPDTPQPVSGPALCSPRVRASPNPSRAATVLMCERSPRQDADGSAMGFDLSVHDVTGRLVRLVRAGTWGSDARTLEVPWDGTDGTGGRVAPGIYFVRLRTAAGTSCTRLVVLP